MTNRSLMLLSFSLIALVFIAFPIYRFFSYFGLPYHWIFSIISVLMFPFGFELIMKNSTKLTHKISLVSTAWFASSFLIVASVIFAELLWLLFRFSQSTLAWIAGSVFIGSVLISIISARLWHVKKVNISSSKIKTPVSFVQLSDVHANGALAKDQLQRVFAKAMKLNPQFIVVTGDLIDIPIEMKQDTFSVLDNIPIPIYYELGNHESYVGLEKVRKSIQHSHIQLLENKSITFDDIALTSISDSVDKEQIKKVLPTIKRDMSKFQLLLYHKPWGYLDAANRGIDLMLSGHTHAGQFFPIHVITRMQHKYMRGTHKIKKMIMHISTGSGTFMWPLRLGSINEITHITLSPQ